MNCLTLTHTLLPLTLAFIYIYFMLLFNHTFWLSVILLCIFLVLFVLYGLSLYALFHHKPGYESYESAQGSGMKMSVDKIGQYKENERRLNQLILLMRQDLQFGQLQRLRTQYIEKYQLPSFCNICQIIKCPRTVHCQQCDKCVLRRQKHSQLIKMCIGIKNMKTFIQYTFISMVLSFFMVFSLLLIAFLENNKLQQFSQIQITIFAIFQIIIGGSMLLFIKQFLTSYFNAIDNITQTERKYDIITKNNNPFKNQSYYQKMFQSKLDLIKIEEIADPNNWIQFNEDIQEK